MRIRHALIAVATATAAVATATPASATASVVVELRLNVNGITMVGTGAAVAIPNINGTVDVLLACQAVAVGLVDETGLGCYLVGSADGIGYFMPADAWSGGNVDQTYHLFQQMPGQNYVACMNVGYRPVGGARTGWLAPTPQCALVTV